MRMNKLALAIMLLAGATAASAAETQSGDPAGSATTLANPAASAVSQPDNAAQGRTEPVASSAKPPLASASPATPLNAVPQPEVTAPAAQRSDMAQPAVTAQPLGSAPEQQGESRASDSAGAPASETPPAAEKGEAAKAVAQQKTDADAAPETDAALTDAAKPLFTPEQEARIGEVAKAYLLAHPKLLIEVDQQLQKVQFDEQVKAMTAAVLEHQDRLLNDPNSPAIGPAEAKVALIEFFDYQCSVCARQAPIIESLMQSHPQVRFIFKEWPIFGSRWKPSFQAAETGLTIWQQKGADAYLKYHNALFATGHIEGELTQRDITKAASVAGAGKLKARSQAMLDNLSGTDELAKNLGFQGTPGIIVMPLSGADASNVTVIPGGAMESTLQAAIERALGKASE